MTDIKITAQPYGTGTIHINGADLTNAVGWPITIDGTDGNTAVTLRLPGAVVCAETEGSVALDDATTEALHVLGWQPPATGDEASDE